MADTNNQSDQHQTQTGPNQGQKHGGQEGDLQADGQHNQATAIRTSGEQNSEEPSDGDRDQQGTKTTNPSGKPRA